MNLEVLRGAIPSPVGTKAGTGLQYRPLTKKIVPTADVPLFTAEGQAGSAEFTHAYIQMTWMMLHMNMTVTSTTTSPWNTTRMQKMMIMVKTTR